MEPVFDVGKKPVECRPCYRLQWLICAWGKVSYSFLAWFFLGAVFSSCVVIVIIGRLANEPCGPAAQLTFSSCFFTMDLL